MKNMGIIKFTQHKVLIYIVVGIFLLLIAWIVLLNAHHLMVEVDQPEQADAILVLSGAKGEREAEAAKLYHEGYSDKIIVSMAQVGWNTYTGDIMRMHLVELGVPNEAIFDYGDVSSTREEAKQAVPILQELGVEKLILTTSKFHSGRAQWIFNRQLKKAAVDIEVISVPVRDEVFDSSWLENHKTRKQGASELMKFVWEWLKL
ncbi:YdcF family protein [Radiobacillus sp. PE A8.2]|uniref:YdcF family protein n=1 Tax=Radiobacillus sp. PE A8.2 TaxID=3380349 RepID=UPI00388ED95D